jgi:hypothetical protein
MGGVFTICCLILWLVLETDIFIYTQVNPISRCLYNQLLTGIPNMSTQTSSIHVTDQKYAVNPQQYALKRQHSRSCSPQVIITQPNQQTNPSLAPHS